MRRKPDKKKPARKPVTQAEIDKARRIADAMALLSLMNPGSFGNIVNIGTNITARRVAAGIYFQHVVTNTEGIIVHVHSETRTDLVEMGMDLENELDVLKMEPEEED
jgi:hypothetical protein